MAQHHIPSDVAPSLFHRRVLELWDYEFNPALQAYERVAFRALHVTEPPENPSDVTLMRDFYGGMPLMVQRRIDFGQPPPSSPPVPPPGVLPSGPPPEPPTRVPPPRPPPPSLASPPREESPESPAPSGPYSPTDTPTRMEAASPPWSPDREHCDQSLYVARHDHQFSLPPRCPNLTTPPFSAANPPLQPPPEPRRRRAPPPPPTRQPSRGRGILRRSEADGASPYLRPAPAPAAISFRRARNLFSDFVPNLLAPGSPPPMVRTFPGPAQSPEPLRPSRTPSPDVMQEVYSHSRHPVDERSHLTILPSWALKADKEQMGECIICYGEHSHLQICCRNCSSQKVCCICVVGVYQSINSCPTCRFRGEF